MRDWEEVAYSIDEEQSWRKEEAASSGKWKFEEVAFTMADSPEKGKIILDLTLPKLEITPKPGGI